MAKHIIRIWAKLIELNKSLISLAVFDFWLLGYLITISYGQENYVHLGQELNRIQ